MSSIFERWGRVAEMNYLSRFWMHRLNLVFASILVVFSGANANTQTHVRLPATWGKFTQAVDQSHLNASLNAKDMVVVKGPHFVGVGSDGVAGTADDKRVRFFGINVAHEPAFPTPVQARETAATLRSLGFNAVRLHHLDTLPSADPNVFRSTLTTGPYPTFHEGAMSRLKGFINVLKQDGIYINLNLMVGYRFRPKEDNVPALDEKAEALEFGSPVYIFHPRLIELQVRHAQELIKRLGVGNSAALAQVEIINESSLAAAWIRWDPKHWERHIRGPYEDELNRQWKEWVLAKYLTEDRACKEWGGCTSGKVKLVTPSEAEIIQQSGRSSLLARIQEKAESVVGHASQELGISNPLRRKDSHIHQRLLDFMAFLVATDQKFLNQMRTVVRKATRQDMPVTGTQMSFGAGLAMLSHAGMDYVDEHFYSDELEFPAEAWAPYNWRIRNQSVSGSDLPRLLNVALYRDHSRPFVVSEFSQAFPNRLGPEMTPIMAAMALQQDWDGLYLFDYVDGDPAQSHINSFNLQGDWARTSLVVAAARMFRTDSLPRLERSFTYPFSPEIVYRSVALRRRPDSWTLHLQHDLQHNPHTALHSRVGYGHSKLSPSQGLGAMLHQPMDKHVTFSAPNVSGIFGEVSTSQRIRAGEMWVEFAKTNPTENITLMAHSLDNQSLVNSRHILLANPGYVTGTQPGSLPPRPQKLIPYDSGSGWWTLEPAPPHSKQPSSPRRGLAPLWMERKSVKVGLNQISAKLTVFPLGPQGERMPALPANAVVKTANGYEITLNASSQDTALWFELIGDNGGRQP